LSYLRSPTWPHGSNTRSARSRCEPGQHGQYLKLQRRPPGGVCSSVWAWPGQLEHLTMSNKRKRYLVAFVCRHGATVAAQELRVVLGGSSSDERIVDRSSHDPLFW
jgi:hypothetical protein